MNTNEADILYGEACRIIGEKAFAFAQEGIETNKAIIANSLREELRQVKESRIQERKSLILAIQLLEGSIENESVAKNDSKAQKDNISAAREEKEKHR
ncbi:hypothetical protein BS639_24620 [Rouxiella silvae]|uniref:Fumarase D n=1 Tax=Rouxiella silvae TaxID=1646373 RepID=A0AA40X046_9GAMM|nr:DUF2767 family protein [Rouxiella silvae]KQN43759.1 hypothetical protein ASE93_18515 [Serratia sp. Leaf50]MBF6636145.1 DUF2767 family protein [Rouxiella silvae]ORJ18568.1 hypothetical protein BS639_24620 [Rouxiella silvae]